MTAPEQLPTLPTFDHTVRPADGRRIAVVFRMHRREIVLVGTYHARRGVWNDRGAKLIRWSDRIVAWAPVGRHFPITAHDVDPPDATIGRIVFDDCVGS